VYANLTLSEAISLHNCEGMFMAQPSTSHDESGAESTERLLEGEE
jgi:hypothetical protein